MTERAVRSSALVLTDLQRDFLAADGFLGRRGALPMAPERIAAMLDNCRRLVAAFHQASRPVVCLQTAFRADGADICWPAGWAAKTFGADHGILVEGSDGTALAGDLGLTDKDIVLTKKTHGAFMATPLDRLLADRGVDTLVLAGGPLASTISDTARTADMLGYNVYVAGDAVYPPLDSYPVPNQAEMEPVASADIAAALAAAGAPQPAAQPRQALLVVDMQNHFLFPAGRDSNESPNAKAIANVAALARRFHERGDPVIWLKTGRREDLVDSAMHRLRQDFLLSKGGLLIDGTWGAELAPGLEPAPGDLTIVKRGASGFVFTPLHRVLRNLAVGHCVVTGGVASTCVSSTLRDGAALGYRMTVVSDAVYPAGSPYFAAMPDYGELVPTASFVTATA